MHLTSLEIPPPPPEYTNLMHLDPFFVYLHTHAWSCLHPRHHARPGHPHPGGHHPPATRHTAHTHPTLNIKIMHTANRGWGAGLRGAKRPDILIYSIEIKNEIKWILCFQSESSIYVVTKELIHLKENSTLLILTKNRGQNWAKMSHYQSINQSINQSIFMLELKTVFAWLKNFFITHYSTTGLWNRLERRNIFLWKKIFTLDCIG